MYNMFIIYVGTKIIAGWVFQNADVLKQFLYSRDIFSHKHDFMPTYVCNIRNSFVQRPRIIALRHIAQENVLLALKYRPAI